MRQPLSGRGRGGGFTLIEVLSAALFAVDILLASTLFPMAYARMDAGGEPGRQSS